MKRKIFAAALFILLFLFPFRYAFMDIQQPHLFGIVCMIVSLFGFLLCLFIATSDDEKQSVNATDGKQQKNNLKQAA